MKKGLTLIEILVIIATLAILACLLVPPNVRSFNKNAERLAKAANDARAADSAEALKPVNYGSGVYYFRCVDTNFPAALAAFLKAHPELEATSSAPNVIKMGSYDSAYGASVGYTVTTHEKKIVLEK